MGLLIKNGEIVLILNPLAQATIFAVVLSEVLVTKIPDIDNKAAYAIYLMAGMAAWGLFAEIMTRCTTVFIDYSNTLKKIAFPRLCLPSYLPSLKRRGLSSWSRCRSSVLDVACGSVAG